MTTAVLAPAEGAVAELTLVLFFGGRARFTDGWGWGGGGHGRGSSGHRPV